MGMEYVLVISNYPDLATHTPNVFRDLFNRLDATISSTNHNLMFVSKGAAVEKSQKYFEVCVYLRWRYLGFLCTRSTLSICGGTGTDLVAALIGAPSGVYIDKLLNNVIKRWSVLTGLLLLTPGRLTSLERCMMSR